MDHIDEDLLLFRSRGDVRPPEWVSAERRDVLRGVDGSLRLRSREITVDESVLRTQNLALCL
jgi:phthalate 3,4-dioxygenase subunit beta